MSEISKYHPYNALWAQLGDLYGAIGSPPKISKTIVCGNHRLTINKVLNVLTYFVRCGEIRRDPKSPTINKDIIDTILVDWEESKNDFLTMECVGQSGPSNVQQTKTPKQQSADERCTSGLTRNATCIKDLNSLEATNTSDDTSTAVSSGLDAVGDTNENVATSSSAGSAMPLINNNILVTFKRNDIPNVFIFRDSRFVRQELRIGNTLMDCGIERTPITPNHKLQVKSVVGDKIKLLVTSPDNEELNLSSAITSDEPKLDDSVEEAKEDTRLNTLALLWGIEPIKRIRKELKVDDRLIDEPCDRAPPSQPESSDAVASNCGELKRSRSLFTKSNNPRNTSHIKKSANASDASRKTISAAAHISSGGSETIVSQIADDNIASIMLKSCPSLSDLITANSVGISERLTWGIERVKETVCYEEEKHFEFAKQMIEKNRDNQYQSSDVVFVLGENEALVGLKHGDQLMAKAENHRCDTHAMCTHMQRQTNGVKFLNERADMSTSLNSNYCYASNSPKMLPKQQQQIQLINLPMPKYTAKEDLCSSNSFKSEPEDRTGFVPSLFLSVTDHYVSDVVLQVRSLIFIRNCVVINVIGLMLVQGTVAAPSSWEYNLKQNLALSAHCATIEQTPTENIGIIANTDNW